MTPRVRMLPWLVTVLVLLLLVYALSLSASFQFDDWQVVLRDPRVQSLSAWWHSMPGMRALTKLSYALNHEWSSHVEAFRAVNVALHALNTALVFVFVRTMAQRLGNPPDGRATAVAVLTALVFALHPVQTESVTYIAARPNLIATLFSLASLVAWLKGRERHTNGWWSLATLCFIAALAGKETAAVLPLAMLLCLAAEHRLSAREAAFPLGLCGLFGLLLVAVWAHFPYDYLLRTSLATRGPLENLLVQATGLSWLVGQLVRWDRLNADPMLQVSGATTTVLQGALLMLAFVGGLVALRRRPAVAFGILWFFLWLAPTNSLLARLDLANDRQLYLALLGPAWLLAQAVSRWPRAVLPLGLLLGVLLATATFQRNRVYATEVTFWHDVVTKSPHNGRAWNNLGMAEALSCRPAEAASAFEKAMRVAPDDFRAEINLALLRQGELPGVEGDCAER